MVAKAEHIDGQREPALRGDFADRQQWPAQALYEELYCARGDMENRIKEQYQLFADRVSTETMRANQLRLYLSAMAYMLVSGLRRLGLKATELAQAEVATIRPDCSRSARWYASAYAASGFRWPPAIRGSRCSAGVDEPALLKTRKRGSTH